MSESCGSAVQDTTKQMESKEWSQPMSECLSETDTQLLLTFFMPAAFDPITNQSVQDIDGWEDITIQRGSFGGKDDCMRLAHAGFLELSEDGKRVRLSQKGWKYVSFCHLMDKTTAP